MWVSTMVPPVLISVEGCSDYSVPLFLALFLDCIRNVIGI